MAEFPIAREAISKKTIAPVHREIRSIDEQPRSCKQLLSELPANSFIKSKALEFGSMDGRDVYNITAPFHFNGRILLLGRVERRDTECSEIVVFENGFSKQCTPCFRHPAFQGLQDPCITWAGDELVLGGVRFPVPLEDGRTGFKMEFYRGRSLRELRHFLTGPPAMKDIRFKQLTDGRVAVFSRPQGSVGGRGQIGFTLAPSWDAISSAMIADAPLFNGQLLKDEWGGVNEVHTLTNGNLGVLGHIACFDERGDRHYYPMVFSVDVKTRRPSPIRIIAQRSFFPPGPSKRPDLRDVVFSGGLIRNSDGTADLYVGTSDAAAAVVKLPDPFLQYEN
ncbi:MAG TPA: DUF1861 family protein [Tepidisphaeraceae bacterium]|nr:DUF1861 family protein [Tepidisphaeraceae bacterium]